MSCNNNLRVALSNRSRLGHGWPVAGPVAAAASHGGFRQSTSVLLRFNLPVIYL